jgi:hypothetical protein
LGCVKKKIDCDLSAPTQPPPPPPPLQQQQQQQDNSYTNEYSSIVLPTTKINLNDNNSEQIELLKEKLNKYEKDKSDLSTKLTNAYKSIAQLKETEAQLNEK